MNIARPAIAITLLGAALCSDASCSVSCNAALALAAGDDPDVKPGHMLSIVGGTFKMGDVFDEGVRFATPVHEVTVSSFYLNKYETTVEEFAAFVKETSYVTSAEKESEDATAHAEDEYNAMLSSRGAHVMDPAADRMSWMANAGWKNPQYEQSPKEPVTCVSWRDAVSYCNWLSTKENLPVAYDVKTGNLLDAQGQPTTDVTKVRGYRLPTEAEWEYAARERGKKIRFGNGRNIARSSEMNFNAAEGEFPYAEKGEFRWKTTPVGSFTPNSLGLYDMSGNVWEWCSDFLGRYAKQSQTNPYEQKGMMGPRRAARDGPWAGDASWARASARIGWVADDRCSMIGFRIARSK
jgi:formylglycine-generating enzyme required for sulfatase activity